MLIFAGLLNLNRTHDVIEQFGTTAIQATKIAREIIDANGTIPHFQWLLGACLWPQLNEGDFLWGNRSQRDCSPVNTGCSNIRTGAGNSMGNAIDVFSRIAVPHKRIAFYL